jgi:hypothetical protein
MRKTILVIALLAGIAGCTFTPAIADLESDKVVIQYGGGDLSVVNAEAQRGCSIHSKTAEGPVSSWLLSNYGPSQYLYACK